MKKALVIVPHPDDEINIAGCLFGLLTDKGYEITVAICCNGDYFASLAPIRYKETNRVKKILGYDHLIYLGYGDDYQETHIYDLKKGGVAVSSSGHIETYHPTGLGEYCYQKTGKHHAYTRANFKRDIKDVILEIKADLVLCVDLDVHPDHRCVSLLFDEAMSEIIKETKYRPTILKKFAYLGVWHGANDYFYQEMQETKSVILDIPQIPYPYKWEDRVRIILPAAFYKLCFWTNPVFRALICYKTQSVTTNPINCAALGFERICNSDSVYWLRRTDNLLLDADIQASSGEVKFLNDFKLYETTNVRIKDLNKSGVYWCPKEGDSEKSIVCSFKTPVIINELVIYQEPDFGIKKLRVITDNGFHSIFSFEKGPIIRINTSIQAEVSRICLNVLEGYGETVKIGEIEAYEFGDNQVVNSLNLSVIDNNTTLSRSRLACSLSEKLYRFFCKVFIWRNRRVWERLLKKSKPYLD